ncbi:MAG: aspartate aminotransferase family protein, partial [Granulosicoccaceae bacterium]
VDNQGQPDGERAGKLMKAAEQQGLLLLRCGTHGQIIRWLPPLIISREEVDEAMAMFASAIESQA